MANVTTALFTTLAALALLPACATTGADRAARPAAGAAVSLGGTAWQSACSGRAVTRIAYEGGRFRGSYRRHADDACTAPISENRWDGAAAVGDQLGAGQLALDLSSESFAAEMLTDAAAAWANAEKYCGLDGWVVGEARDVYGLACAGWAVARGARSFERVQVDGERLYFGAGTPVSAETTAADRPAKVDRTRGFQRVSTGR